MERDAAIGAVPGPGMLYLGGGGGSFQPGSGEATVPDPARPAQAGKAAYTAFPGCVPAEEPMPKPDSQSAPASPSGDCPFCDPCARWREDLFIAELPASWVYLCDNQRFRGWTIVIAKGHYDDLFDAPPPVRAGLDADAARVSAAVRRVTGAERMNYALFGNMMPHLHWNLIPRRRDDGAWGKAPWPHEPVALAPEEAAGLIASVLRELG